ncbi:MAG: hypothetical protein ACYDCX_10565 [Acidithiobacillus sp.]
MDDEAVLISIHPKYAAKILAGEKHLEFRRIWAARPVDFLVIYATYPVQRIVAVTQLGQVFRGSKNHLWQLSKKRGGGVSRRKLFKYMDGKKEGVALELLNTIKIISEIDPREIFGEGFRPPQSFRYLSQSELSMFRRKVGDIIWE